MDNDSTEDAPKVTPPHIPEAVVRYLERVFPNSLPPTITYADREIPQRIGRQDVVTHLRHLHEEQAAQARVADASLQIELSAS